VKEIDNKYRYINIDKKHKKTEKRDENFEVANR
jgi:hypothetical protein